MNREEIVQAVQSYIRNENEKYALLINGAWGSGKTFLYENYLCDAISDIEVGKNERKKNVYISLYGISTIETLSKQLMTNYLVYVKANGNEIVKKGAKPVAGFLGIVSKAFSFSIGSFSADFGDVLKDISGLLEAKNMVVCFDDLERCTIPINEFFGYVNNLIEHCNCKVLILADENNIGKVFANTNIEQKYQTILTGDRKVIQDQSEENKKKNNIDKNLITIRQLKELNERLYSENFIYRDIKEKVIGKTCNYYPEIKENLVELISGTDKHKGCVGEGDYKEFLVCHMDAILSAFSEVDNRNLRIIIAWLDMFRGIFVMTNRNMKSSQYYENIISDFLRYSIWAVVSNRKNKKIIKSAYYGNSDYVYFEGHEYTHTIRYYFIDKYIRSDYLDEADLVSSARSIEARCEREKIYNNYIEFWDDEHRCIHLHGKIDLSKLRDKKDSILVSAGGMNYKEYAKAVDNIRKTNSVIEFYPNDIVFAPSEVEKDKLVCVTGISPSNRLYPADDLFLYRAKELYADLDLVDELDVFGMSPFGDESIIEKINEKNLIRIFVYNKNENDETKVWESKLKCKYELLESDDMK